jgi:hypothetical protein
MKSVQDLRKKQIEVFAYYLCMASIIWIGLAFLVSAKAQAQNLKNQNITPINGWERPRLPVEMKETLKERFKHLDPDEIVPARALQQALQFFIANEDKIPNKKFITIIDYAQHSSKKRMFLINLETGNSGRFLVAHGKGSDQDHDGYAERFSDVNESRMSSLGFFITGSTYNGKHGETMRLNGVSKSNDSALERSIVFHGADYVSGEYSKLGRSFGCPAVEQRNVDFLISRLKDGSLFYSWFDESYKKETTEDSNSSAPEDQKD